MFVSPAKIIEDLGVGPSMTVADFGCGSGHYSIEAAKKVGKSGKVFAIDIQQDMLGFVRTRAKTEDLTNIETIWTDLETPDSTRLASGTVDLVFISNILFQAEDKNKIIQEAFRILKSGGRVSIIEWDIESQIDKLGPPMDSRISKDTAKSLLESAGFVFKKEFNPGDHHYGFVFRKLEKQGA